MCIVISGVVLVVMNIVLEYGFGVVIVVLLGFMVVVNVLGLIWDLLLYEVVMVIGLVGVIGLVFGGLSIVLVVMLEIFIVNVQVVGILMEVLYCVVLMVFGGMDSLLYNGVVIMLLMVIGLIYCQVYKDIFVVIFIKIFVVFVVIGIYYVIGWV